MTNAFDKEILIGLNEDSVRRRKLRMKATSSVKTTSRIQVVSMTNIEKTVPDKKYEDFHGSTGNDMMTLVNLPSLETMWSVPVKVKHEIYVHENSNRRIVTAGNSETILSNKLVYQYQYLIPIPDINVN